MLTTFERQAAHGELVARWMPILLDHLEAEARAGRPQTERQIATAIGLKGPTLRAVVHALRVEGQPLASSGDGYWLAEDPADLETTIAHGRQRASSIMEWVRGLERTRAGMAERRVVQTKLGI